MLGIEPHSCSRERDAVLFPPVWQSGYPLSQSLCQTGDPPSGALSLALWVDRMLHSYRDNRGGFSDFRPMNRMELSMLTKILDRPLWTPWMSIMGVLIALFSFGTLFGNFTGLPVRTWQTWSVVAIAAWSIIGAAIVLVSDFVQDHRAKDDI